MHTLLSTTYFVSLNSPRLIIYCIDFYLANKKINIVGFSFWLKEVLGYEALAKFLLEKMVSAMIIHIFSRKSILNFILFFLLISWVARYWLVIFSISRFRWVWDLGFCSLNWWRVSSRPNYQTHFFFSFANQQNYKAV